MNSTARGATIGLEEDPGRSEGSTILSLLVFLSTKASFNRMLKLLDDAYGARAEERLEEKQPSRSGGGWMFSTAWAAARGNPLG